MTTAKHQILIVGGGTAGITVAARMLRKGYTDVAVIEPASTHYYQPLWTLVGGGQAKASTTERTEASVMPKKATWIKNAASALDPDNNTVTCADGATYEYDVLVVCPGIQLDWNRTDGLEGTLGKDGVSSNYRFDLAPRTWDFIRTTRSGSAVFTMPSGPVKCAGAAQKIAYLACDHWRKEGVLNDIDVHLVVPTPRIFGIPEIADNLDKVIADYGINLHTNSEVTSVDAAGSQGRGHERRRGRHQHHAALRRAPRRPAPVGAGLDQVEPAVDRRRERVRRHRQAHDAARALPEHLQPRRRRVVTELQDRRRDPQTGPGRRRQHRRVPEEPGARRRIPRLRVVPARHVVSRDAAGRVRLLDADDAVDPLPRPGEAAPGVLVPQEIRTAVHVLEPHAQGPRLNPTVTR